MESGIRIKNRPRVADGILFVLLIVITALSPRFLPAGAAGETLIIQTPGSSTTIPLGSAGRYPFKGPLGTAFLVVENGGAHLENAPCPFRICEAMGPIDSSGEIIVCLPNKIVVKVSGPEVVDAVSR